MDIRTVFLLATVYNCIFAVVMIIYGTSVKKRNKVEYLVLAFLTISVAFLLIGARGYIIDFFSIMIGNFLVILANIFIFFGLKKFYGDEDLELVLNGIVLLMFTVIFSYFTFANPNTNIRIVIIAVFQIYYFYLVAQLLISKAKEGLKFPNYTISAMLFFIIGWNIFRIIWVVFELPIDDFMNAGWVHSVSVIIYHLYPMALIIGVMWMSNIQYILEIQSVALLDPLTGLPNRRALYKQGERDRQRAIRNGKQLGIILCDIDDFKFVNDTWGHEYGDKILHEVSKSLVSNVRKIDLVSRYGGEEFVILLQDMEENSLTLVLEKVRSEIEKLDFVIEENLIKTTVSIGSYLMKKPYLALSEAIRNADDAMYYAKRTGKNKCVLFKDDRFVVLQESKED